MFIGKYIERIDLYTRFHLDNSELDAPLAKLETYSRTLDGMPLPSCFVSGISWLLGQLPSRGYPELTSRLNEFLTDFNRRAITGDPKDAGMLNAMNMDAKRP